MMKHKLITGIISTIIIVLQACNSDDNKTPDSMTDSTQTQMPDHNNSNGHGMRNDLMSAMNTSMEKMKSMKMSGDFDHDFATMMIEHHQGAIEMAQVEVSKGSDATMKSVAEKVIDEQKSEISMLRNFINEHKPGDAKSDGHDHLGEAVQEMMNSMNAVKMTGNIDKDFAMMMIPHHEGAIKMAEDEISHGKNLELKKMAQKMMDDQAREIEELRAWLDKNK